MNNHIDIMDTENQSSDQIAQFKLTRATITSMNVYEIDEYELNLFEQGGNGSNSLGFATFLLSSAFSFLTVLLTVELPRDNRLYVSFFTATLVGFLLGFFMLLSWWRGRASVKKLGKVVRSRLSTAISS